LSFCPIIFTRYGRCRKGDADFVTRGRQIKSAFSRRLPQGERISGSRATKGERVIWQRRYWEHTVRDEMTSRGNRDQRLSRVAQGTQPVVAFR
jgi:hypothetical protein